ncbi:class I adenylate-forming enzyme family protein [Streptomyces sp. NPDC057545]|uniref:class I adenylate-forming enzyme family protein n=1 Tax=Streptomyces sp. NPDC057545 TaxID=3346164 RepID=UPI0036B99828
MPPKTRTDAGAGVISGPPLDVLSGLLDAERLDDLLSRAARTAPVRYALRSPDGGLTYAELDARVSAFASALRAVAGGPGETIALTAGLDLTFPVTYYGIARSSNVSVIVNPLLPDDRLVHLLATSRVTAAVVTPDVCRRLAAMRERLPDLRELVLTHREPGLDAGHLATVDELIRRDLPPVPADGDEPACLQFTSGTTGAPKAVRLSHRNLTVNAAQTVHGNRLSASSVLFNYLPVFHPMHLNAGVAAAATIVLYAGQDLAEAVRTAARYGATHFYSLPVQLARLAVDPRLPGLSVPTLQAVLSGGSALAPRAAAALSDHFRVPVVQGYGLAETSPSTHLGDLDRPKPGSCGVLVPGTDCRIVDIDTGTVRPRGARGEIQVRGPQLMLGYLGRDRAKDISPDGWFATGDVGYVDEEGFLFVVDRIKDVFKCDNWLVAPSGIEQVLAGHPAVRDCVVLDRPDAFHGAVGHALVVADGDVEPAELTAFVNARVPSYEHLHGVDLIAEIPRSPTGKVPRRELRAWLLARLKTTDPVK